MTDCPSCGRYVGPYDACPYCGAHVGSRTPIRVVKIAAVVLATVGLAALWFAATRSQVPLVQIGQLGSTMNMAYVRVEGSCTRAPTYDPETSYLSFVIADDSGEMRVSAYRAEAQQLVAEGRVPALGDVVTVAGTLRVREDAYSLTINVPEQVEIVRPAASDAAIGSIVPEDAYRWVRVRGEVRSVYSPYEGLKLITVRDATGEIPVAVSADLEALTGALPELSTGQAVEVLGVVSVYRDTPQLVPPSVAAISADAAPVQAARAAQIGQLTTSDRGQLVAVEGTLTGAQPFSSGIKYTLDDGTGSLVLLLWDSVLAELPDPGALDVGASVAVQGEVSVYRGELELVPELGRDVSVVTAAPAPEVVTLGSLAAGDVGRVVTVRGALGAPQPFSAGVKFVLVDDSGQIVLLLWQDVFEAAPGGLDAGAQVEVTGEVSEYRGELELTPRNGGEIAVTGQGSVPTPAPEPTPTLEPAVPVGSVTAEQVGQVLVLEGTLGEPQPFSAGVKFVLDDGSGQITLLLWQNVYDALPDAAQLAAGTTVRVTGEIDAYQGELEIVPEADGVTVTGSGPAPTVQPAAAATPVPVLDTSVIAIGTITSAQVGQTVNVQGVLGEPQPFSAGVKFVLSDGSGSIVLLLWQNVYDALPDAARLVAGATLRVTGEIDEYRGELEIIPEVSGVVVQ